MVIINPGKNGLTFEENKMDYVIFGGFCNVGASSRNQASVFLRNFVHNYIVEELTKSHRSWRKRAFAVAARSTQ